MTRPAAGPPRRLPRSRGDVRRMLLTRGWTEPTRGDLAGVIAVDPSDSVTWYNVADGESSLVGGSPTLPGGGRVGWEIKFYQDTPARVIAAACVAVAEQEASRT
jgi:hypothetical protein